MRSATRFAASGAVTSSLRASERIVIDDTKRLWAEDMPAVYEQWLVPTVFRPFAIDLAQRVAARRPQRILELAAGTGVLTRELTALLPHADIVATDFNDAMVDVGRRHVPTARWQQADAMRLPFDVGEFDLVCCQFGVMFFPDRRHAFADARRVLAPGGALVFNVWGELAQHHFEAAVVEALATVFPEDPPTFLADIPHGHADPAPIVAALQAAGFGDPRVEAVTVSGSANSAADLATGYCYGTPLRGEIAARADLVATRTALATEMTRLLGVGEITGQMTAYVYDATSGDAPSSP